MISWIYLQFISDTDEIVLCYVDVNADLSFIYVFLIHLICCVDASKTTLCVFSKQIYYN